MRIIAAIGLSLSANLAAATPCVLPGVCETGNGCEVGALSVDIVGDPPASLSTGLGAFEVVSTAMAGEVTGSVTTADGQDWRVFSRFDRIEGTRAYGDGDQTLTLERHPGGIVFARLIAMPRRYAEYAAAMKARREYAGRCPEWF